MPNLKKAELIEGIVHMPSPVRAKQHGSPNALLVWWLTHYSMMTVGTDVLDNATIRLDAENEPQPDGMLYRLPEFGGSGKIDEDGYFEGPPEFIAEIAASSVSIDLHAKLRVYCRNRIQEYLVWRVEDQTIDWFSWHEKQYIQLPKTSAGIIKGKVFPGLWLDPEAMVRRDMHRVLEVLQKGLASPEHAAYVQELADAERELKRREGPIKNG
jgi:Uma2 family endonuclease